jgi:hypothetical protein
MAENKLPIGSILKEISIIEDQEFGGDELCLDRIQLIFQSGVVILQPLVDTDEIEIISSSVPLSPESTCINSPTWCSSLLGKKLQMAWICENHQGYQNQIIFAFERFHPTIAFIAEGSVIKVFHYEQITRKQELDNSLKYSKV